MSDELKASSLDFGALIAFVAPGFVALLAMAYQLPSVRTLVAEASTHEQTLGVFLFALLASLSLGLAVSGVRSLAIDFPLDWLLKKISGASDPTIDWKTFDIKSLTMLLVLRDNYYRYYQFYSNMAVAVALWAVSRTVANAPDVSRLSTPQWVSVLVVVAVLLLAAGRQLRDYYRAKTVLAG